MPRFRRGVTERRTVLPHSRRPSQGVAGQAVGDVQPAERQQIRRHVAQRVEPLNAGGVPGPCVLRPLLVDGARQLAPQPAGFGREPRVEVELRGELSAGRVKLERACDAVSELPQRLRPWQHREAARFLAHCGEVGHAVRYRVPTPGGGSRSARRFGKIPAGTYGDGTSERLGVSPSPFGGTARGTKPAARGCRAVELSLQPEPVSMGRETHLCAQ